MAGGRGSSNGARKRCKARVRELTRRNNPLSMFEVTQQLNTYLRGWVGYFRVQEFRNLFRDLNGWIRSRQRDLLFWHDFTQAAPGPPSGR